MRSLIFCSVMCFALLQLVLLEVSAQNGSFVEKTLPKAPAKRYNKSDWAKMVKSLTLVKSQKVKIKQPKTAGKWLSLGKQIIGGVGASLGQFPWQAYLHMDNAYVCGGSLILTNYILTAAHCADPFTNFTVVLGNTHRYAVREPSRVRMFTTVKIVHEAYNNITLENDIAILQLPNHVNLTQYINVIKLPSAFDTTRKFVNTTATVSGYGATCRNCLKASETLNSVQLKVMEPATCLKFYSSKFIKASTLCTHTQITSTNRQSICKGDSGGPLVYMDSTNAMVQIGVVSFGPTAGCDTGPSGFARVTHFLGWISSKVGVDFVSTTDSNNTKTNAEDNPSTSSTSTNTSITTSTNATTAPSTAPTTSEPSIAPFENVKSTPLESTLTPSPKGTPLSTQISTDPFDSPSPTPILTTGTPAVASSSTPLSTSTNPASTTATTPKPLATKKNNRPLNCAGENFANMSKCCKVQPNTTFIKFDSTNKTQVAKVKKCGGSTTMHNNLNQYLLNKLQDIKKGNAMDFTGKAAATRAFAGSACYANCILDASGLLENGIMTNATLKNSDLTETWKVETNAGFKAFAHCSQRLYSQTMSYTVRGNTCDGRNFAVIQCMQKFIIAMCGETETDSKCTADWQIFNSCQMMLTF